MINYIRGCESALFKYAGVAQRLEQLEFEFCQQKFRRLIIGRGFNSHSLPYIVRAAYDKGVVFIRRWT